MESRPRDVRQQVEDVRQQVEDAALATVAVVRPRLGRPDQLEDAAPPRFAQAVGLGFGVVALLGYAVGADLLGTVATGFALAAAFLNAAFGLCLGCEVYLLLQRAKPSRSGSTATAH